MEVEDGIPKGGALQGSTAGSSANSRSLSPARMDDDEAESSDTDAVGQPSAGPDPSPTCDDDPLLKAKKQRVAVMFGYVGTHYQGLQKCV
jgi:hypothetical protein